MSQVYGVRESLAELRDLDKDIFFEAVGKIKRAAKPLARAIDSNIPKAPPLSGMARGRAAWKKAATQIVYGGRRDRRKDEWPLLKLVIRDGGAVMFDTARNGTLGANLTARFGSPSRAAWRPERELQAETVKAVEAAISEAMAKVNARLVRRAD